MFGKLVKLPYVCSVIKTHHIMKNVLILTNYMLAMGYTNEDINKLGLQGIIRVNAKIKLIIDTELITDNNEQS